MVFLCMGLWFTNEKGHSQTSLLGLGAGIEIDQALFFINFFSQRKSLFGIIVQEG